MITVSDGGAGIPYPKSIFIIVACEFCERFCYYGLRALLVLYMISSLGFSSNLATGLYHLFTVLCYVMPLFGAILADGYIGKFRTILFLSIGYAVGTVILSLTALPPPEWIGPMIGLLIIAIGTGGIKPCVAAFGGDQFTPQQVKQRNQFFSLFYFSINAGSVLSMVITPFVKEYVKCFGSRCYSLAFAIPAFPMVLTVILFGLGYRWYKITPITGNIIGRSAGCVMRAVKNKYRVDTSRRDHWLDYADDKYESSFIEEVKGLFHVIIILIPMPVFWALFDQQGSRWTIQSTFLDLRVTDNFYLPADQIQALNPILILIFVPFFEVVIYPILTKLRIPNSLLQRMVAGMFFAGIAFVVAAFLQIRIEKSNESIERSDRFTQMRLSNVAPCALTINSTVYNGTLATGQETDLLYPTSTASVSLNISTVESHVCGAATANHSVDLQSGSTYTVVLYKTAADEIAIETLTLPERKPTSNTAAVNLLSLTPEVTDRVVQLRRSASDVYKFNVTAFTPTGYQKIPVGSYKASLRLANGSRWSLGNTLTFLGGGVYTLALLESTGQIDVVVVTDIRPNSVAVWNQIPQYVVMTTAEVLFAVSALSFCYAQAPKSMKSVVQALFLLTTALGNIIDVVVAMISIPSQVAEFFFFAILIFIVAMVFAIIAHFYKSIEDSGEYYDIDDDDDRQELTLSEQSET